MNEKPPKPLTAEERLKIANSIIDHGKRFAERHFLPEKPGPIDAQEEHKGFTVRALRHDEESADTSGAKKAQFRPDDSTEPTNESAD
jgi:hypothetical protein